MPKGQPPERLLTLRPLAIAARRQQLADKIASGKQECARCHEVKAFSEYTAAPYRPTGVQAYCRPCHAADMRQRYRARRDAVRERIRKREAERRRAEQEEAERQRLAEEERQALEAGRHYRPLPDLDTDEQERQARQAHHERRATAVAVRWAIGCTQEDAVKVAALVEPRRASENRVQAVANMPRPALLALARRAGVQPGERPTSMPRFPIPVRYAV